MSDYCVQVFVACIDITLIIHSLSYGSNFRALGMFVKSVHANTGQILKFLEIDIIKNQL